MKHKLKIITTAAASLMTFAVLAQETANPRKLETESTHRMTQWPADRLGGAAKASDIIGMTVNNYQDEKLGRVEDLAVDVESGRIVQVIVSTGGFLGMGDTLTAVPPGALHHDVANKVIHLDANKEKLSNAPKFENSKWAEYSDSDHLSQVYRYYGQESAYTFVQRGDADLARQRNLDSAPITISTRNADGTWTRDRIAGESQSMIPASRLGQVQKGSKIIGTAVKNRQDEKLGKVENILLDMSSGRIVAVIVSSGGFIGMGDELSAVPPTALRFNAGYDNLQLDATKETLVSSPHFKANQWPDLGQPTYASGVYRAYNVEPYFNTDGKYNSTTDTRYRKSATAADNTQVNVRDRDSNTLTPLDQGTSKSDVATTAQIRKEIIAGKNMSVNAQNVKIITINGRVTLRGPVNSVEEKRLIGEIANRIAQTGNVDNQLEVKITTTSN